MSLESKRLDQIVESTFGQAFLAQILGLNAWEIISGQTQVEEISYRATAFDGKNIDGRIFSIYSDFIREYAFGYTHDWTQLAAQLDSAKCELAGVLSKISTQLIELGFASAFDPAKQFVVLSDGYSQSDSLKFEPRWKSNAGAWWTHPNTQPSFQGSSMDLTNFAFDDAIVYPAEMSEMSPLDSPTVYQIHGKEDWVSLVGRFPVEASIEHLKNWKTSPSQLDAPIWLPDWRKVAESYQGVYLSPAAYLGASYSRLTLGDDRVTFLGGWSPGSTFWLPAV